MKQSPPARCKHQSPQPKNQPCKTLFPRRRESIPSHRNEVAPTLGDRLLAGFDQRLAAALLDLIAILVLYGILNLLLVITNLLIDPLPALPAIAELLLELYLPALAYNVLALRFFNATAGKRLLGIRVMRIDGGSTGWGRAFIREFLKLSPLLPISAFMVLVRQDKRGLHDVATGAVVTHAAPGIPASRIE